MNMIAKMYNLGMISFVYFDVGGVAMLDFSKTNKWADLKHELHVTPQNDNLFEQVWAEFAWDICLNRDVESLIPIMREEVGLDIADDYSLLEGFLKRYEVNHSMWPLMQSLQSSLPIGLLTNMYPGLLNAIKDRKLLPDIKWHAVIDSSVVGYQKPDKEIFEIAEKEAGIEGKNILFVENTESHINTAKQLGWQTFLYDPANPEISTQKLNKMLEKELSQA
jgi:FMN phosphatase YigB (HAD superfamily)